MGIFGNRKKKIVDPAPVVVDPSPGAFTMMPGSVPVPGEYFVRIKVTFLEKLRKGDRVLIKWPYAPGVTQDMIDDIVGNCQCTAKLGKGPIGISATFTHQETKDKFTEAEQIFTKYITVYFRDGKGKVSNGRGEMVWPDDKEKMALTFTGVLVRPS